MKKHNMTYTQVINWMYEALPMFQNIGGGAYKPGLEGTLRLMSHVGNPHDGLSCVHVAGTNGKGSVSHLLASVLMEAGYHVGLYTSPHLVDFRERIRVDGEMVTEDYVTGFVEDNLAFFRENAFSFFEMTTAMAFSYFRDKNVDIAVIETGLGGRLDCTNVVTPMLSVVTNIALDHTAFLGNTRAEIAREKAGIIKCGVPVVLGEADMEILPVFMEKAREMDTVLYTVNPQWREDWKKYECPLRGEYQRFNVSTVVQAYTLLKDRLSLDEDMLRRGIRNVLENTHLQGRWQVLGENPYVVCDTGHNVNGMTEVTHQLAGMTYDRLHVVFGMVGDKDVDGVLSLLPRDARYYFTAPSVKRALGADELKSRAERHGLSGEAYDGVGAALAAALSVADRGDAVYVGGSTFVVADALVFMKGELKK